MIVFALVLFQMVYAVRYEYYDGDDAYYIATAVITEQFDSMYLRDAYTGYLYPLDTRHAFHRHLFIRLGCPDLAGLRLLWWHIQYLLQCG